jgi:hypothetical protein
MDPKSYGMVANAVAASNLFSSRGIYIFLGLYLSVVVLETVYETEATAQ